jgi:hypothetical protein
MLKVPRLWLALSSHGLNMSFCQQTIGLADGFFFVAKTHDKIWSRNQKCYQVSAAAFS